MVFEFISGSSLSIPLLTTVDLDCDLTVDVKSPSEIPTDIKPSVRLLP